MARLVVIYKTPKDAAEFDKYYFSKHVALAKKIPGLKKYDVSDGLVASPSGGKVHLIATLQFDSAKDIEKALGSADGQAAAGDLPNFADGGCDLYFFDTKDV